jgi:S1-C subfamily serine protease
MILFWIFLCFFNRSATVYRENGSFGFVLAGNSPVCIESVDPGGAADRAGLQAGDGIVKVNKIDVRYISEVKRSHFKM